MEPLRRRGRRWSASCGSARSTTPDQLPPDIHIFTASKQPWVVLPPGTPAVPEYYDREQYWPAESLARREAMLRPEYLFRRFRSQKPLPVLDAVGIYRYILSPMSFLTRVAAALDAAGVRYALVGGYAVALHGAVRGTVDVDVILAWDQRTLRAAEKALVGLGLVSRLPITADDALHVPRRVPPQPEPDRVELLQPEGPHRAARHRHLDGPQGQEGAEHPDRRRSRCGCSRART